MSRESEGKRRKSLLGWDEMCVWGVIRGS